MKDDAGPLSADYHLQRLIANWHHSHMAQTMGMRLVAAADGTATIEAVAAEKFYNPQLRAHGGFAATIIDSALGCAVFTKLPMEVGYGTIELKVNYVGKLDASVGVITCVGKVIHAGRTMMTAEARLTGPTGKLYAHGSGTFLVYPG
jgi:acyl-CoA thioesterase